MMGKEAALACGRDDEGLLEPSEFETLYVLATLTLVSTALRLRVLV